MRQLGLKEGNNNGEEQHSEDGQGIVPVAKDDQNARCPILAETVWRLLHR